ncbi:MAG: hypothetical protein HRU26_05640 [Psychroserpens sp.]|nr:hypothetical protein [Psychroserpens sp.]
MSIYKELSDELIELRKNYSPKNKLRIEEIDSLLKKIDKQIGVWRRPIGNYKPHYLKNWK